MVNNQAETLDRIFDALSDPTRRAMVAQLARGDTTVTHLGKPFDMSLPAISKHVKVLERAGLLIRTRQGRVHRCRLDPAPLAKAVGWIGLYRQLWEDRFDALEAFLQVVQADTTPPEETPDDSNDR